MYLRPLLAATLMSASFLSSAEVFVSTYTTKYQGQAQHKAEIETYLSGVGHGLALANFHMEKSGLTPLFCPPSDLALAANNYLDILDRRLKVAIPMYQKSATAAGRPPPDFTIDMELLSGLQATFPCKQG